MGAIWYRAKANLRRRIGGTVLLALLVAVPAAIVMASVAGAIRARDALPAFVERNNPRDTEAFAFFAIPEDVSGPILDEIEDLPQWAVVGRAGPYILSLEVDGHWVVQVGFGLEKGPWFTRMDRPVVLEGALPDMATTTDVVINEPLARDLGVHAGDTFPLRTVTPGALDAASSGRITQDPDGEDVQVRVAAVVRRPQDISVKRQTNEETFGTESWLLAFGPAFLEQLDGEVATYGTGVQGVARPGRADALANRIAEIGGDAISLDRGQDGSEIVEGVQRAIDFEANALLVFAVALGVTTAALAGQAIGRHATLDLDGDDALRAAGATRLQRSGVTMVRATLVAIAAAASGMALAVVASRWFPIGLARQAELDRGVDVDGRVLLVGGALVILVVLLRAASAAWAGTRTGRAVPVRVSVLTAAAARANASAPTVAGVRMAVERGRGRTAVPVVGAMVATTAGVAGVAAILVFAASLTHLVGTPELQGWTWDANVANLNDPAAAQTAADDLRSNPDVGAFIGMATTTLTVDDQPVYAAGLGPGDVATGPPPLEGRIVTNDDEIVVGAETLELLDKEIGDTVAVAAAPGAPAQELEVVGTAVMPAGLDPAFTFGRGALMEGDTFSAVQGSEEPFFPNTFLVEFAPGVSGEDGLVSLEEDFAAATGRFQPASDTENLDRVQSLPRVLVLLMGLLALGTLTNALVTSVRRHRRDLATFAALGFGRRQLSATVAWQASTFTVVAVLFGIPLGIAGGRFAWQLVSDSVWLDVGATTPALAVVAIAVGALVAANLVAFLPARSAARTRPAEILRTE